MTTHCIAAASYPIEQVSSWNIYAQKIDRWVKEAFEQRAQVLLFPEYATLELIALLPKELHHDVLGMRPAIQTYLPQFLELHQQLAQQYGVCIVAGSLPVAHNRGYTNRAYVFGASGQMSYQDKLMMTRFEAEEWDIQPGQGVRLFEHQGLKFGVVTCYDSEFPMLSRQLAEAGAEILLVPSFTGNRAGYTRVRVGSMARALENQCYVVHAPLIANADWTYAIEQAEGMAGIYVPSDHGLPEDGVIASSEWNSSGWLIARLDLQRIRQVRTDGHVLNWRDRNTAIEQVSHVEQIQL